MKVKTILLVLLYFCCEIKAQVEEDYLVAQNLTDLQFQDNQTSLLDFEDERNLTTTMEEDEGLQKSLYLVFQSNQGCQKLTSELMQNFSLPPPALGLDFSYFDDFGDSNSTIYSAEPGSSVNLTCLSESPHGWTSTAPQFSLDKDHIVHEDLHEVAQFLDLLQGYNFGNIHYFSTLWIKNASYMHVGKYSCQPLEGNATASRLHLYVYDSLHPPSVPLKKRQTITYEYDVHHQPPLLIPCRPAHPSFQVALSKENDKYFTWIVPHFYHPGLGFVFPYQNTWFSALKINLTHLEGTYFCHFRSPHIFSMKRTINVHVRMANLIDSKATISNHTDKGEVSDITQKTKEKNRGDEDEVSDATQKRPMSSGMTTIMMTMTAVISSSLTRAS